MTAAADKHITLEEAREVLYRVCEYDLSLKLWGYDVAGDIGELAATVSEHPEWETLTMVGPLWDRDVRWLETVCLIGELPPESWCLPWLTEWKIRRGE